MMALVALEEERPLCSVWSHDAFCHVRLKEESLPQILNTCGSLLLDFPDSRIISHFFLNHQIFRAVLRQQKVNYDNEAARHMEWRAHLTLLWLIFTNYIYNTSFPKKVPSEVLGVRTFQDTDATNSPPANVRWKLLGLSLSLGPFCLLDFIQGGFFSVPHLLCHRKQNRRRWHNPEDAHKIHHGTLSQQHPRAASFGQAQHSQVEMSRLVGEALLQVWLRRTAPGVSWPHYLGSLFSSENDPQLPLTLGSSMDSLLMYLSPSPILT